MHSNIGEFYGAFSQAIHNRKNKIASTAAYAAAGAAAYGGGQLYNNRTDHQRDWLGNSMSYAGAGLFGMKALQSAGIGQLMTSGGLQRLGDSLSGVKFSEGGLGKAVHGAGKGVNWLAEKQQTALNFGHKHRLEFLESAYGTSSAGKVPLGRANATHARWTNKYDPRTPVE